MLPVAVHADVRAGRQNAGLQFVAERADGEAGPRELEVTEDEAKQVISFMKNALVTGKENAMCVTGGTTILYFTDSDGNSLGAVELYDGLLVMNDGMYQVEGGGG